MKLRLFSARIVRPRKFSLFDFSEFYLQPMDSNKYQENLNATHPIVKNQMEASLQTHKILGIR